MQNEFWQSTGPTPNDSTMCARSEPITCPSSMSSAVDFRAKISVTQERVLASLVRALACGPSSLESLAKFDPESSSWKTLQLCLVAELEQFSATWPRSGMTHGGIAYLLPPSAPLTEEIAFLSSPWLTPSAVEMKAAESSEEWMTQHAECLARGVHKQLTLSVAAKANMSESQIKKLWPTPRCHNANEHRSPAELRRHSPGLGALAHWPTPQARDEKGPSGSHQVNSPNALGIRTRQALNPAWVENLMGFPSGWTEVSPQRLDMNSSHGKRQERRRTSQSEQIGSDALEMP